MRLTRRPCQRWRCAWVGPPRWTDVSSTDVLISIVCSLAACATRDASYFAGVSWLPGSSLQALAATRPAHCSKEEKDGLNKQNPCQLLHLSALRFDSWFYPKDGKVDPGGGGGAVVNWTRWAQLLLHHIWLSAGEMRETINHANGKQTKSRPLVHFYAWLCMHKPSSAEISIEWLTASELQSLRTIFCLSRTALPSVFPHGMAYIQSKLHVPMVKLGPASSSLPAVCNFITIHIHLSLRPLSTLIYHI